MKNWAYFFQTPLPSACQSLHVPMVNNMAAPVRTQYEQRFVALQTVLQLLQEQRQVGPLIEIALRFLREDCGYPVIWLALYDAHGAELVGQGGVTPISASTVLNQRFPVSPGDIFDQALITGLPVTLPNLRKEHRAGKWQMLAQRFELQGTLIQPICYRHQSLGLILVGSSLWGGQPRVEETAQLAMLAIALGNALHLLPQDQQQHRLEGWHQSVLTALDQMATLSKLEERLDAVVRQTYKLMVPDQTSVYWFEPEQRYFWCRATQQSKSNGRLKASKSPQVDIRAQDIEPFWQSLQLGEVVAISEIQGVVSTNAPLRLMQQQQSRSLLSAPIICQQQLLGFVAVAGVQPRLWQDHEKQYLQAAAQLLALAVPADRLDTNRQSPLPSDWVTQLIEAIPNPTAWQGQFTQVLTRWRQVFQAQWVILLHQDDHTGQFLVDEQSHSTRLRPLVDPLPALSEVDGRMVVNSEVPIAITNLSEDLRLLAWHQPLLKQGIRSLLLARAQAEAQGQTIVLLGTDTPYTWSADQCDHWQQVTQALGVILEQQYLYLQQQQQERLSAIAQQGLVALQQSSTPQAFESTGLETLVEILQVPFAALIRWQLDQPQAEIVRYLATSPEFEMATGKPIDLEQAPLLKSLWQSHQSDIKIQQVKVSELVLAKQTWLQKAGIGQVLAIPLQAASSAQPLGAILLGDTIHRTWSPVALEIAEQFVRTLAWFDRTTQVIQTLAQRSTEIDCLNWYKQRQLEQSYTSLIASHQHLQEAIGHTNQPTATCNPQRTLQQIQHALVPMATLIQTEAWELQLQTETVSLTTLLRRTLNRVDPLIQTRQLWLQVHNLTKNATLTGNSLKLELILHELLLAACYRSQAGGRIDLWCRLANPHWLEVAITDHGHINPRLVSDLQQQPHRDWLAPSTLDQPPGCHFNACHHLVQKLGGRMQLSQLEDGRVLSRLILQLDHEPKRRLKGAQEKT